jgi:phosphotransferase system enzyme I (PtsI)
MLKGKSKARDEVVMEGIGVAAGVVAGLAFLVSREEDVPPDRELTPGETVPEVMKFENAIIRTRAQIRQIRDNLGKAISESHANIFDVHLMVLDDRAFLEEVVREIEQKRRNVEAAVRRVSERYADGLSRVGDEYLRERVADVKDVARRVLHNVTGQRGLWLEELKKKSVIVANDLAPSEAAVLEKELVLGFATDLGSATSHTAIMARALRIPAVVGLRDVTARISAGDEVLIDGGKGLAVIHPTAMRLKSYGKQMQARRSIETGFAKLRAQPAETRDGHRVRVCANIELASEVGEVLKQGAQGVGLFRSEYLYLSRPEPPTEDEQARVYEEVARRLAPQPVVIRTVDLGGDKFAPHLTVSKEVNPFMGFRGIRFSLAQPEMFKAQLRAILRAGRTRNLRLMYPMISNVGEVVRANRLLAEAKAELRERGVPFADDVQVGAMIETPAAALTSNSIAEHVRFFSLGTNDLAQYTLAVDRVNDRVAHLYEPTHPAVLRLIDHAICAAHNHGLRVAVCGEMAGDPIVVPLLVGLGVDELSMAPAAVPIVKDSIRSIALSESRALAAEAMASESAAEVLQRCRDLTRKTAPEILELVG